jgi:hypothetical protein
MKAKWKTMCQGGNGWAWWHTLVIPTLGKMRQKDYKFQDSICYIIIPCPHPPKKRRK